MTASIPVVMGVCTQPDCGSHESRVQVSPSLQADGFPGSHSCRVVVVVLAGVVLVVVDASVVVDVLLVVVTVGCVVVVVTGTMVVVVV